MSFAAIILAHRGPRQVARLVQRLVAADAHVVLHLDRKRDAEPFESALAAAGVADRVDWCPRIDTRWGEYSLVEASLAGLARVARHGQGLTHAVLLSGQCYPIRGPAALRTFFARQVGVSFLAGVPLPAEKRIRIERTYRTFRGWRRMFPPAQPPERMSERLLMAWWALRTPWRRTFPACAEPWFGSQWWCLSLPAVHAVLDFCQRHPEYVAFMRESDVPDEMFFHSIVLGSEAKPGIGPVEPHNLTFADWSADGHPSPRVLGLWDLAILRVSNGLFARKFDAEADPAILDAIDRVCEGD